jgi:uncharacterized protein YjbI with pentapeptide repeats
MVGVSLRGASLREADLRGTDFRGSKVLPLYTDANLFGADCFGARYDSATRWPLEFDPAARGCILCDNAEAALPIPARSNLTSDANQTLPRPSAASRVEEEEVQNQLRPLRLTSLRSASRRNNTLTPKA